LQTQSARCNWRRSWSVRNSSFLRTSYELRVSKESSEVNMQPKLTLLSDDMIARILEEAYQLLLKPGVKVNNEEARDLLATAGAQVDAETNVVHIPGQIVSKALESAPREFYLYDSAGNPAVKYGGDTVHFDPGSSGIA